MKLKYAHPIEYFLLGSICKDDPHPSPGGRMKKAHPCREWRGWAEKAHYVRTKATAGSLSMGGTNLAGAGLILAEEDDKG